MIKDPKDWSLGLWRKIQYTCVFSLILFLWFMNYPIWHSLIILLIVGGLTLATHVRQTAMGLILASLDNLHKAMTTTIVDSNNIDKDLPN